MKLVTNRRINEGIEPGTRTLIIVGEGKDCDFKTLSEAVENAEPGSIIKISEGTYRDTIKITKPGLRIEPRNKQKDKAVYVLGEEGPCITIDLKPNETCVIKGIIFAHFGSNIANKFNEQIRDADLQTATPKYLKQFVISKEMECIMMFMGGNIVLKSCLISLKSLPENIKVHIPALVAMPGCKVNIVSSEFRGNEAIMTGGAIMLNSEVLISDCKFHNFRAGALWLSGTNDTNIKISDTTISTCGVVGIYSQGRDCKPLFLRMKIEKIEGPAIKIYKANRAKVKGSEISKCHIGIEVICGDPFIVMNKITKNFENGILTVAKNGMRCDALIKFNQIVKNKDNGIL